MNDWPDLLARTYAAVRRPVALLDERLLERRTPCSDWNVGQLFEHVVGTIAMFGTAAGASTFEPAPAASPLERYDVAVQRNLAAWSVSQTTAAPWRCRSASFRPNSPWR